MGVLMVAFWASYGFIISCHHSQLKEISKSLGKDMKGVIKLGSHAPTIPEPKSKVHVSSFPPPPVRSKYEYKVINNKSDGVGKYDWHKQLEEALNDGWLIHDNNTYGTIILKRVKEYEIVDEPCQL